MADLESKTPAQSDLPDQNYDPAAEEAARLEQEEKQKGAARLLRAQNAFRVAADSRRRYDWEWLSRDLFRRGYQFSRYNPTNRTVVLANKVSTRIPVNLTTAAMRVIRNQVTSFRPKWEVVPKPGGGDKAQEGAVYQAKLLDGTWKEQRLKKKVKETVMQGLITSVGGPWQMGWDPDVENRDGSKGNVVIWQIDPFDFYIDPNCTDGLAFTDAEHLHKAVRRSLDEVKNNPDYKNTELLQTGDPRVANSEYKQFLLQTLKYMGQTSFDEGETVILKETWMKERDANGKVKIRVITWVDHINLALRDELLDESDYPFRMYQADINPLEVYGESWARHVIPINRVINALESSTFDYNYRYGRGRLVIDKNAGVRQVDNSHGGIIEKNRGAEVRTLPLQPLPSSYDNQIQRMRGYFEDISGAHDVSLGRIPNGVKSGVGVAELKQADATNQDDLVDNLEDFLVEVGTKVLNLYAKNLDTPRVFEVPGTGGQTEFFAVVGEDYAKRRKNKDSVRIGQQDYPLIVLPNTSKVDVQIGSWLAYSKQAQQEELKNLYQIQAIDQRTLLEHLEFGDIEGILDRTRVERLLKARAGTPGNTQSNVPEEELARSENEMMLEGKQVDAQPQDDHEVHIAVHQEAFGKGADDAINAHIQQHQALMQQAPAGASGTAPSGGGSAAAGPGTPGTLPATTGGGIPAGVGPTAPPDILSQVGQAATQGLQLGR